jgi:NADPH:quinone reductase-like Zn-dependent oxidoreductase
LHAQCDNKATRHGLGRATQVDKYSAFQLYSVVFEIPLSPIPDSLPYEQAVVLPLAISTAAAGLYQKELLALPYPSTDPKPSGRTILVWGGSSSVGATVIQLAVASGLEVVSTASKKNYALVKSLGAKHVLDYTEETVVDDIVSLLKGSEFVGGYDAISTPETVKASADIVHRLGGGKLARVLPGELEIDHADVKLVFGEYKYLSSSSI